MATYRTDCRHFSGYRPCHLGGQCEGCDGYAVAEPRILFINIDALGDVLRNTSVVNAIRRAHPCAGLTWLTQERAVPLLEGNPQVDRVLSLSPGVQAILDCLEFDLVLNADKSLQAGALAMRCRTTERRGFGVNEHGAIVPLNAEAEFLYRMGLDDHLKFFENTRSAQAILCEALGFAHQNEPYVFTVDDRSSLPRRMVGFNTGCGPKWPQKKLSIERAADIIRYIFAETNEPVLLLGGPDDTADHAELARMLGERVERTPTDHGLRVGAVHLNRVDVVLTGDSLGMHMAIGLEKEVVAWFGPTSPAEIDLYGRGEKMVTDFGCAPCWSRGCSESVSCNQVADTRDIAAAVLRRLAVLGCTQGR